MSDVSVVDLYCGAGGLSYGFSRCGFKIALGVDVDSLCAYPFEANTGGAFLEEDVGKLTPRFLRAAFVKGSARVLSACAPCQPFSEANVHRSSKAVDGWKLINHFFVLAEQVRPELVVLENVPGAQRSAEFSKSVERLRAAGYRTSVAVVDAADFGAPQRRKRLILLGSRLGELSLQKAVKRKRTVKDAIADLSPLEAGDQCSTDPLHRVPRLAQINLRRIRASSPGSSWNDWPQSLRLKCHQRGSGMAFVDAYGRMEWDLPSPTVTTKFTNYGSGRFGHPDQDRTISLREGALLQGFPKKYRFAEDVQALPTTELARLIGNAVPVDLARHIGREIVRHIK